jgi:serine/threonine-protein phosphatase 2A regulatory subunit A
VEKEHLSTLILLLFKVPSPDDQDTMRLLAIESSAAIAKVLSHDENTQHALPTVRTSVEDRLWHVRYNIAMDFYPVRYFLIISLALSRSRPWDMATLELSDAMGSQITEWGARGVLLQLAPG